MKCPRVVNWVFFFTVSHLFPIFSKLNCEASQADARYPIEENLRVAELQSCRALVSVIVCCDNV